MGAGVTIFFSTAGDDTLTGGGGDTVSYVNANAGVTVSLALQPAAQDTIGAGVDTLSGFHNLTGSIHADTLIGDANDNTLTSGGGYDTLQGGGGADTLIGDGNTLALFSGNIADYAVARDWLTGKATITDIRAGSPDGMDTLLGVDAVQFANGGLLVSEQPLSIDLSTSSDSYKVTYDGSAGLVEDLTTGVSTTFDTTSLQITTGSGDDTFVFNGYYGDFTFDGGGGQNHFVANFGNAPLGSYVNVQTVDITTHGGGFLLQGGDGDDALDSTFGFAVNVDGGGGDDTISGGGNLFGGDGNDVIYGGFEGTKYPPTVQITGGAGDDTIYGHGLGGAVGIVFWPQDVANYSGDRASYSIMISATGETVVKDLRPGSPDGTDTLFNVAVLRFADVSVALQSPGFFAPATVNTIVEAGLGTAGVDTATQPADFSPAPYGIGYDYDLTSWTDLGGNLLGMDGTYGSAVLDLNAHTLTYTLDNTRAATNALAAGATVTDDFLVPIVGGLDGFGDGFGDAILSFGVTGTNDGPTPTADTLNAAYAATVIASSASLTANDTDPEGDALTITAVGGAQHGMVSLVGGNVTFTPFIGYVGAAGFSYTVDDGHGGTATGQVSVNVTGNSPAYIYRGSITTPETIAFTGDGKLHQVLVGSGDATVLMGSGGGSARLGAGNDVVIGAAGKDAITFGPGLGTATGGAGPDAFIFVKGQVADPTSHGGQYDTVTDFVGAGGWVPGRDFIWLQGFSHASSVTYEGDLTGSPTSHLYRVDDGAYHAEFVLQYAGPGVALAYGQYGFL